MQVATDSPICSVLGRDLLESGGNAVDAAVASALCVGAVNSFASGIGGGGFMVSRRQSSYCRFLKRRCQTIVTANGTEEVIDFRETAPAAANKTM